MFVGKRGGLVKRCLKCREKDDRQKKRPEVIAKHNARQNERQYKEVSRAKKLEEDPDEFRRRNAEKMKAWRASKNDAPASSSRVTMEESV